MNFFYSSHAEVVVKILLLLDSELQLKKLLWFIVKHCNQSFQFVLSNLSEYLDKITDFRLLSVPRFAEATET
jgi:hypothetical protein